MREWFDALDSDGDGALAMEEFVEVATDPRLNTGLGVAEVSNTPPTPPPPQPNTA